MSCLVAVPLTDDLLNNKHEQTLTDIDSSYKYITYKSELDLPLVQSLIDTELSEPYSIFTYRFFLNKWPDLCFIIIDNNKAIGTIVCKLEPHNNRLRGYIAMLAVDPNYRGKKLGTLLVKKAIDALITKNADEIVLETEINNFASLALYEKLGFVRSKLLKRYYMNGIDAYRLKYYISK